MAHSVQINHDTSEPYSKQIFFFSLIFSVCLIVIFITSLWFYRSTVSNEIYLKEDVNISSSLQNMREEEDNELRRFGWVDKSKGVIKLPIDMAMRRIVESYQGRP